MKVLVTNRGAGKTSRMIERSALMNIPIICFAESEVQRIKKIALEKGHEDFPEPIAFNPLRIGSLMKGHKDKSVIIDNADIILQKMLEHVKIDTMTLSYEENQVVKTINIDPYMIYEIINETSESAFEKKINKFSSDGWYLQGDVQFYEGRICATMFKSVTRQHKANE